MPDEPELTDIDSMAVDAVQGLASGPSLIATKLAGLDDARDDVLADPVGALESVAEDAVEMVTHPADAVDAAVGLAGAVAENIATTAGDIATGAADAAEWAVDTAGDAVEGAAWVVTHPEQAIVDAGEAIIGEAGHLTGGVVSDIADEAGAVLEDVDEATGNIVSDTYETISDGVSEAADEVGAFFEGRPTPAEDRARDSDSDEVTDWDERNVHGTDPLRWDTDGDGLGDGRELREYGTDPTAGDSDKDGLADGEELRRDTDPFSWDTDGDGWSDGMEARFTNTDPLRQDTDRDGLTDRDEGMVHRTDPNERDSDGDGMGDGNEVRHGTDPLDFGVAQPYAVLDEADLTVGGHDPLPVAGTIDDARGALDAHADPSGQPIRTLEPQPGDFGGIETGPSNPLGNLPADPAAGALTSVDEAPTEVIRPSPIQDAVTSTPDEGSTELLPPSPIDDIDLDGLTGLGDPFTEEPVVDDHVADAVSPFDPGGLDTDLAFGG